MAVRPSFGALKKAQPTSDEVVTRVDDRQPTTALKPSRIQTSIRLDPAMWAALNDLATRKRIETHQRVTVHDLLIEGGKHVLAVNGIKLSE
jgi:hypothetical protein